MDIHLSKYEELERGLPRIRTEEEVVDRILIHHAKIDQGNVTTIPIDLFRVFDEENFSTDLLSIKDNLKRIRAFRSRWFDKIKKALDKELFSSRSWLDMITKNEAVADLLRKRGNEYFIKRNFDMALRAYTLAGMYAPKDSKSLALSYSNRSACFAETNNWHKCLEDIKRFESIWNKIEDHPTPTRDKVAKRKEKCLIETGSDEEDISLLKKFGHKFFKLKTPSAVAPSLEDFLGVKTDPKKGRGIYNISDKAIEPGTLLILDDAYCHVYCDSLCFDATTCSACFKILDGSGIPCGGCVFNLYCSQACAASDHHNIHSKYECKIAPYLYEVLPRSQFYSDAHLALLILLKLGPHALLDHYRQLFNKNEKKDDKGGSGISSYLPIYNLICHEEIFSEFEILEYCKYAVILTEILDFGTDYFTCLNLDELEGNLLKDEFSRRIILHQMCIKINANLIGYKSLPKGRSPTPKEIRSDKASQLGFGVYSVTTLINHSCAPNANWLHIPGGAFAVFASEHIVPGQEVLVSYRGHYSTNHGEFRRQDLWRHFGFNCECTACTDNWPLEMDLKPVTNQSRFPFICPDCRMKVEVFDEIRLNRVTSKKLFVCPRDCGYNVPWDELKKTFISYSELAATTITCLDENKILKTFTDAKKCVRYFDTHLAKPNKEMHAIDSVMQQPLQIIAGKMFE